jgi:predicted kinase
VFVIVSGPPGSGKSTTATLLARELELPLVAKDTIKDALMSVLPVADVDGSRLLGRAAVTAMLAVAADSPIGAVLDCNFHRSVAANDLRQLPGRVVEVFCRCDRDRAWERFQARAGDRHAGHFDAARSIDDLYHDDVAQPVAGGWPVVEVDTNRPVTSDALLATVNPLLR